MGNVLAIITVLILLFIVFATWSCLVVGSRCEQEYIDEKNKESFISGVFVYIKNVFYSSIYCFKYFCYVGVF